MFFKPDAPDEATLEFDAMLRFAVEQVLAFQDFQAAFHSFLVGFCQIAPRFAESIPAGAERQIGHALFREVWNRTPRPDGGWKPATLPKPERNNTCPCGSGTKYKQCCGPMDSMSPFPKGFSVLAYVMEALPETQYAALPFKQLDPEEIAHVADTWREGDRGREATLLLEALLASGNKLDARHEHAFDLLCDLYLDTFRDADRLALVERIMQTKNKSLRAAAWQRRATLHADAGEYAEAWQVFKEVQRLDPDNPSLAHLELVLLANQERFDEVGARAAFWAKRLARLGYENEPIFEFVQRIARDPDLLRTMMDAHQSFEGVENDEDESYADDVATLLSLIDQLPNPRSHYTLSPIADSAGPLKPSSRLAAVERAWRKVYWGNEDEANPWHDTAWLQWLQNQPLAWQSFAILQDVLDAMEDEALMEAAGENYLQRVDALVEHGVALLREVLSANQVEGLKLEWAWLQNRPALRFLMQLVDMVRYSPKELPLLEWLVRTLNPDDNSGHRERLVHAYCETGRAADALVVCDRYSNDMLPGTLYGRVLALYLLDRRGEAVASLKQATERSPKVLKMLVAARPKAPKIKEGVVMLGGDDEAWLYRIRYLATWQHCKAYDWLKQIAGRR